MPDLDQLRDTLRRIDGRSYRSYREITGAFEGDGTTLFIDHVQSDPFATPSKLRVRIPAERAGIPTELFEGRVRRIALCDFLARQIQKAIREDVPSSAGSGKSGRVAIDAGNQEVLERCAVAIESEWVEARLTVGLPASGRRARGREAAELLCQILPRVAERGLLFDELPKGELLAFVECVENQEAIRDQLEKNELIAFVANGSILPRESGASDRPLAGPGAVAFQSPPSMEVAMTLPNPVSGSEANGTRLRGMGIARGVTLIVGGGYHGKSTLLKALERCVHPHVPGDGREYVVSAKGLAKIRAEDGRSVTGVDISAFIGSLPGDGAKERNPQRFFSKDASGSTSQAANIAEALEAGAEGLLLDEDTCATNFMVRDERMQALVASEDEPITPFVDRVRELFEARGLSTVLVMGGSGAYFEAADLVIAMQAYRAQDVTRQAHDVAQKHPSGRRSDARGALTTATSRIPDPASLDPARGRKSIKVDARGRDRIVFGTQEIDLLGVEQILDASQTRAIALALVLARERFMKPGRSLIEILDAIEDLVDTEGLAALDPYGARGQHPGALARPRRIELAAALNRHRGLRLL